MNAVDVLWFCLGIVVGFGLAIWAFIRISCWDRSTAHLWD